MGEEEMSINNKISIYLKKYLLLLVSDRGTSSLGAPFSFKDME
jgi:hypothetical protein